MDESKEGVIMTIDELIIIISDVFNIKKEKLTMKSSTNDISEWDSIGHLNLILEIERNVGTSFSPEQISEMTSVENILSQINEK